MRRVLMIAAMALFAAWSTEASANLIVNGDFEFGTLAPWTASGAVVIDSSNPNNGNFDAAFFSGSGGSLSQLILTLGTNFTLSFALNNGTIDPSQPSSFVVNFGGNQVISFTGFDNIGAGYVIFTLPVSTLTAFTSLSFTGINDDLGGDWLLDDVSLVPVAVPEPSSVWVLGAALALLFGLSFTVVPRLRPIRKRVA